MIEELKDIEYIWNNFQTKTGFNYITKNPNQNALLLPICLELYCRYFLLKSYTESVWIHLVCHRIISPNKVLILILVVILIELQK